MEGKFSIHGTLGRILFDTGASYYFIATSFAKATGLLSKEESTVTCVDSPLGNGSLIFIIRQGVGIEIGSLILPADMLVLDMFEYDAIIGMDWLVAYRSMIDCFSKTIIFAISG